MLGRLLFGSLALFPASAWTLEVVVRDGLVSVDADDVPVQDILDELAAQQGIRVVQQAEIRRPASLSVDEAPLAEVLDALLDTSDSYQLFIPAERDAGEAGTPIPPTLWVFEAGTGEGYRLAFHETVLLHGSIGEKKESIRHLRHAATPGATRMLSLALGDEDERVRSAAMEALTAIDTEESTAALASAAVSADPVTRANAAAAVSTADGKSAAAYLDIALRDDDPRVRAAATHGLGNLEEATARTMLREAMSDPDPAVRERAAEVLAELDDEAMFRIMSPED